MTARPAPPASPEGGFVLPMVLVVIAIIGLSLWAAMSVLSGMNRDLAALTDSVRLETAAQRAEGRIGYLMLTEPIGGAGLRVNGVRVTGAESLGFVEPPAAAALPTTSLDKTKPVETMLRFDGSPYRMPPDPGGGPSAVVRIQDDGGLFNISSLDETATSRFLQAYGLKEETARHLAATLADFVDPDDLNRLNGAEKKDYERARLPPPPNANFREPGELWRVMDWRNAFTPAQRADIQEASAPTLLSAVTNINTASPQALMAWFGLTREQADKMITERRKATLSILDLPRITGVPIPNDEFRLYASPSRRVRLRVSLEQGSGGPARVWQTWLTRSESAADRPYFRGRSGVIDGPERTADLRKTQNGASPSERNAEVTNLPQSERLLPR